MKSPVIIDASRSAKRIFSIAKETNGSIPVGSLADGQELFARICGKQDFHELTKSLSPKESNGEVKYPYGIYDERREMYRRDEIAAEVTDDGYAIVGGGTVIARATNHELIAMSGATGSEMWRNVRNFAIEEFLSKGKEVFLFDLGEFKSGGRLCPIGCIEHPNMHHVFNCVNDATGQSGVREFRKSGIKAADGALIIVLGINENSHGTTPLFTSLLDREIRESRSLTALFVSLDYSGAVASIMPMLNPLLADRHYVFPMWHDRVYPRGFNVRDADYLALLATIGTDAYTSELVSREWDSDPFMHRVEKAILDNPLRHGLVHLISDKWFDGDMNNEKFAAISDNEKEVEAFFKNIGEYKEPVFTITKEQLGIPDLSIEMLIKQFVNSGFGDSSYLFGGVRPDRRSLDISLRIKKRVFDYLSNMTNFELNGSDLFYDMIGKYAHDNRLSADFILSALIGKNIKLKLRE